MSWYSSVDKKYMCLIAFSLNNHPDYPLILIANRDEFYRRPTAPAHHWLESEMIAGKDLEAGGTWMGVSRDGRFAAVTNYRDIQNIKDNARSRGELPVNFLENQIGAVSYLEEIHGRADQYNGFNLILFENGSMYHYSNYEKKINTLEKGIFGLSNALLDTPWPKVENIKSSFTRLVEKENLENQLLLDMLENQQTAQDEELPETGLPYDLEKAVSAICIRTEEYGTCSSSIVTINHNSEVFFKEKTYPVGARKAGEVIHKFEI